MAKKKSRIKEAVETVRSWVGMGPKAKTAAAKKKAATKTSKKKRTGPIRELAQEVLPGAKERQARRKKRRAKVATAVKKRVKKVRRKKRA
jgi:hypothetical protein